MTASGVASRVLTAGILLILLLAYLRYFEWKNLYYPSRPLEYVPSDIGLQYEDVVFVAEDSVQLHGWWIPHENARGTVIVCHGNAGNISGRIWIASDLNRLGLNVFLFDYRGYGKSRGIPTEKGLYRDGRAAYEVVRAKYDDVDDPSVIIYGRSLGGAVAIQLALDRPVRGIIIESVFTSSVDIGEDLYPWLPVRLFCHDRYDSAAKIGKVTVPVIVAHSSQDTLIPFKMGRELYRRAREPKSFSELRGDHNDCGWISTPEYWRVIERFVQEIFGAGR